MGAAVFHSVLPVMVGPIFKFKQVVETSRGLSLPNTDSAAICVSFIYPCDILWVAEPGK